MIHLSVNVNKVATLRNARGGTVPSVLEAVDVCVAAGAPGITVHPRADARHITMRDVVEIADRLGPLRDHVELNIEGDPRPDLMDLVRRLRPAQCTLVPVMPGEITSQAGWPIDRPAPGLADTAASLREHQVRVSLFVEADRAAIDWAASHGAHRVELYTEPFARAFARGGREVEEAFLRYSDAAAYARSIGLGVNAGHDLDLSNLPLFATIAGIDEVSIGHALVSHALFVGLSQAVSDYLRVLRTAAAGDPDPLPIR